MTGAESITIVPMTKDALRKALRERRDRVPPALAMEAATEACAMAMQSPVFATARAIAAYAPVRGELSPTPLIEALRAQGLRIAYPRVVRGRQSLEFFFTDGDSDLAEGTFGIPEPVANTRPAKLEEIDTFLIPALGFDRMGARLGWGRGYYDATLAATNHARLIGFGFSFQLVDQIPSEPHDLTLHDIITERAVQATQFSSQT